MKMICIRCRSIFTGMDYCPYCSCGPEGIWQMLRPIPNTTDRTADHG